MNKFYYYATHEYHPAFFVFVSFILIICLLGFSYSLYMLKYGTSGHKYEILNISDKINRKFRFKIHLTLIFIIFFIGFVIGGFYMLSKL